MNAIHAKPTIPAKPASQQVPRHSGAIADVGHTLDKPVPHASDTLPAGPPPIAFGGHSGGMSGGMSGGISSTEMHNPFDPDEIARGKAAKPAAH